MQQKMKCLGPSSHVGDLEEAHGLPLAFHHWCSQLGRKEWMEESFPLSLFLFSSLCNYALPIQFKERKKLIDTKESYIQVQSY